MMNQDQILTALCDVVKNHFEFRNGKKIVTWDAISTGMKKAGFTGNWLRVRSIVKFLSDCRILKRTNFHEDEHYDVIGEIID